MKQSDIFSIIIIAIVGTLASYFGLNAIVGDPNLRTADYKTIGTVTGDLAEPDPELFNQDAINPTVEVYVGTCADVDKNGILDKEELVACGQLDAEEVGLDEKEDSTDDDKGDADEKDEDADEEE